MIHGGFKIGLLFGLCVLLGQCCPCVPTAVKGDLTTKRVQVTWTPANQSARTVAENEHVSVGVGDGIVVDASGLAVLEFPDLLTVEIYRDSALKVRQVPAQSPLVALYLELGSIFASTRPDAGSRLRVDTGTATVESLATEFLVTVNPHTNDTVVIVRVGEVQVTGAGQTITVKGGEYTQVSAGEAPSPVTPFDISSFQERLKVIRDGRIMTPKLPDTKVTPTVAPAPTPGGDDDDDNGDD